MPEVSSADAGRIIETSSETIRRHIGNGLLPARRFGMRGIVRVELDDLRKFAEQYQYRFNERLASQLTETEK
jgi:hypothetical protein